MLNKSQFLNFLEMCFLKCSDCSRWFREYWHNPSIYFTETGNVVVDPEYQGLFPSKIVSRLTSWKRSTYEDFAILPHTQTLVDDEVVEQSDIFFTAVIERGSGILCQICIWFFVFFKICNYYFFMILALKEAPLVFKLGFFFHCSQDDSPDCYDTWLSKSCPSICSVCALAARENSCKRQTHQSKNFNMHEEKLSITIL